MNGVLRLDVKGASPLEVEYGFQIERKGESAAWIKQVHGKTIHVVTHGQTASGKENAPAADAVITNETGIEIYVYTADCLPILLAGREENGKVSIAAIHSGWRGSMQGIVSEVLGQWAPPLSQTYAMVGPAIKGCHFEVKQDFVNEFSAHSAAMKKYLDESPSHLSFRLNDFVRNEQLSGIPVSNYLDHFHVCTYCHSPALPSYRRNKGTDPQIRAWIRVN